MATHQAAVVAFLERFSVATNVPSKLTAASSSLSISEDTRFGSIELSKLWKKLYGVRSQIAHGDTPDLKGLGTFDDVHQYVYLSMKALLRLALCESQLVYNLRAC
jgi:hypothetical protein